MVETLSADLCVRAIEAMSHAVLVTDTQGVILGVNPAFTRLTGWPAAEIVGRTPRLLNSGMQRADFYAEMFRRLERDGHWEGEIWNRRRSGETFAELLHIDAIADAEGRVTHYVAVFSDITARKRLEDRLAHLAHSDPLTGVPNRALFEDRLRQALAMARRADWQVAVALLDLDDFKDINDSHGHLVGDHVLKVVAQRLTAGLRESDTVARLGGDEFAILMQGLAHPADFETAGRRLLAGLAAPVAVAGRRLRVRASVGIARYPGDGESPEALLEAADRAMYEAKRAGKHRFALYEAPPAADSKPARKAPRLSPRLAQS